jgi:hypothetical protein
MIALVRIFAQVAVARLLAVGPVSDLVETVGWNADQIVDWLTAVTLGLLVLIPGVLEKSKIGAWIVHWWNLIISLGRSAEGPSYKGRYEA